ncbi:Gfo/Idh/MocA family oxidoreductase (plasmid) [Glaciihabitans sp. INWT7]|uniref:Gfo/Idh/MocA family protein n=1 Tax=Glaciihabitans sp. INWT7 TaxID=2596912 RepID=UPI00162ACEF6|nr:Gfo/Idh/MocA family oxidoreductase [Glaciihabitans sp. INWT7]QNE48644.1 Gfo/Idh/MocA family oxidoreductase [Glaciihabitans sp. INWT7]
MAEKAPFRVALVGAGFIGKTHADVIDSIPEFSLTAIVDPVEKNSAALADAVADSTGVRPEVFADLATALSSVDVDVVVICTPTGYHAANAVSAINAGKHVLIEKPLDVTPTAAVEVVKAARAHPELIGAVISQKRFEPSSEVVKAAIDAGEFGRMTSGVVTGSLWRSQEYYDSGEWRGTWKLDGGGALMNQGVHSIDLLVWFMGRPKSVLARSGRLAHERIEVEDTAAAVIEFVSGALASVLYTTAAYPGLPPRIEVHGDRGSAVIDADALAYYHVASSGAEVGDYGLNGPGLGNQASRMVNEVPYSGHPVEIIGHRRQYLDFLSALRGESTPRAGVEDAFLSLATVVAIYESARTGAAVDFDAFISSIDN